MAGNDLRLDENGDYIPDGSGYFEQNTSAGSAVRHQVLGILESWVGDVRAGRVQRGISGRLASEAEADLERESLRRALAELRRAGLIDEIEIEIEKDPQVPTRFNVGVRTRDTQSGGTIQIGQAIDFGP